jgi:hypothetical protein
MSPMILGLVTGNALTFSTLWFLGTKNSKFQSNSSLHFFFGYCKDNWYSNTNRVNVVQIIANDKPQLGWRVGNEG